MTLVPTTLKQARAFVQAHHRHNKPPQGGRWAAGVEVDGKLAGVVIVGNPIARMLDDGRSCEATRTCTDGTRNACSMLYAAAARAARALGYWRIYTYTLASEPGTSLRAAGWEIDAIVKGEATWSRRGRPRMQLDLFGQEQRPADDKVRWVKILDERGRRKAAA